MRFTKMHGIGNDYVYVNCFEEQVGNPSELAQAVSDRHFGIGSDGLILILPSEAADVQMRMFNADGSEAEMCGNGVRCLAKYAYEHGLTAGKVCEPSLGADLLGKFVPEAEELREITVETGRGVLTLLLALRNNQVERICVDMGEPILLPVQIPVNVTGQQAAGIPFQVNEDNFLLTCVSMGNPHAVFYTPNVAEVDLEHLGPRIENHALFPQRINVHFVQVVSANEVIMRTWERGSGITLACGTGAAAVCVAGILASKTERSLLAHLPGGNLQLQWSEQDNHVYLVGPATEVFSGDWPS
jgi:diaminopimelate epimerase